VSDSGATLPVFAESQELLTAFGPGDFRDERNRRIWEHWAKLRGGRPFPARSQLDPLDIRYALGNVVLVDLHGEPPRFRFRLIGSNITHRDRVDLTGRWIDELPGAEYRATILGRVQAVAADPRPLLVHNRALLDGRWRDYEALWLPFAEDGVKVGLLLCCQIYAGDS